MSNSVISASEDENHLRLLTIFHYVVAAVAALFACFPLIHVVVGLTVAMNPDWFTAPSNQGPPPALLGYFMAAIGLVISICGWALAICVYHSGRLMAQRRNRMFSFVVAAILCTFVPFGTVLGVFTIIILSRPSVQALYAARP